MEIPILIDGAERGSLRLTRQSGAWLCEAELSDLGRVARLSIFGEGQSCYLGIPEPENGRMLLRKALKDPDFEPVYCAESEQAPPMPKLTQSPAKEPDDPIPPKRSHRVYRGGRAYYF